MRVSEERAQQCFGDRARHVLPNGLDIVHLNQYETDYVYKEIFEDHCYAATRHPPARRRDGRRHRGQHRPVLVVRVQPLCPPQVLAFEPSPVVYDLLEGQLRGLRIGCSRLQPRRGGDDRYGDIHLL